MRAGEARFEDEAIEGRSKSLGVSLSYGFAHAFNEDEQKVLALLHFFQGYVNVDALRIMGGDETILQWAGEWSLPDLRSFGRDHPPGGAVVLERPLQTVLRR